MYVYLMSLLCLMWFLVSIIATQEGTTSEVLSPAKTERQARSLEELMRTVLDLETESASKQLSAPYSGLENTNRGRHPKSKAVGVAQRDRHGFQPRILNGQDARIQEVPYQLQLGENEVFYCSAAIISRTWAATVATCLYRPDNDERISDDVLTLRAGARRRDELGVIYRVSRSAEHPLFDIAKKDFDYNIVLLQIPGRGFVFTSSVAPIALPGQGERIPANANSLISGWGEFNLNPEFSTDLQKANIQTVSFADCERAFIIPVITRRMFCAGVGRSGPCKGDEGGPLVYNKKLIGLFSFGYEKCDVTGHPAVYTRISDFRNWIKSITNV